MPAKRPSLRDRPVLPAVGQAAADDLLMGAERRRQEVQDLPVGEIMPNPRQPRTKPSDDGLAELAASISEHGVLQPILVQATSLQAYEGRPCRYELIAGERRWRASQRAGRTVIPAIVLSETADARQMLVLALIENLQREGLHPLDEGLAFAQLQSEFNLTQHEIAARVGKSRGYVQNRIRLTAVPEDLQLLAAERPDTIAHIYEIARIDAPQARADLIAAVRDDRISHVETRVRVAALLAPVSATVAPLVENDLHKSFSDPGLSEGQRRGTSEVSLGSSAVAPVVPAKNDLHKSFSDPGLSEGQRRGTSEVSLGSSAVAPVVPAKNDLHKSFSVEESTFLSPTERSVLVAVASRIEGGALVQEGDDLALLVRLAQLVASLSSDSRERG